MRSEIEKLQDDIKNGSVTSEELVNECVNKSKKYQDIYNPFITIIDNPKWVKNEDSLLNGIPYASKDNYSTKGILSTGSSNILKNYVPFFNATAIENLEKSGAILVSKTQLDEFGLGGTGTTSNTGVCKNPWDINRICGGSSSGSACAVSLGIYPFALGSDTGDSIRKPAGYTGIVGYKPTYGMISRYGLFPFASSLDTCGVLTRSVVDAAIVADAMKGIDEKDLTSWDSSNINLYKNIDLDISTKKICYIKELTDIGSYSSPCEILISHLNNFNKTLELFKKENIEVTGVSVKKELLNAVGSVYATISRAEATSNLSNLTGIPFGVSSPNQNVMDLMNDARTKGFSSLIKRRLVIGSYVLQKENQERYFINAKKARRLIVDAFNKIFEEYDAIVMPVGSGIAPLIKDSNDEFKVTETSALENYLTIANFGGYPSITIPNGFVCDMPVGINITSKVKDDITALNVAAFLESKMNYSGQIAMIKEDLK